MASYETVTIGRGENRRINVDGNTTKANVLYDCTADNASISIRLRDTATLRNIGVKGNLNPTEKRHTHFIDIGGDTDDVTIENVYVKCYRERGLGINVTKNNTGSVTIRRASIHGMPNNGIYASKSQGPVRVYDSYCTNNRVANFRGGGYDTSVFKNCVSVIDDMSNTHLYPGGGGDRTWCFLARHGTATVDGCHAYFRYSNDSAFGTLKNGTLRVKETEYDANSVSNGNVVFVGGNGQNPDLTPPAPTSAEQAASGDGSGDQSLGDAVNLEGENEIRFRDSRI